MIILPHFQGVITKISTGGSSFNPGTTNPSIWLDATDPQYLFDAVTGGNQVGANGSVARWADRSGNGRDYVQSISIQRPVRQLSVYNGKDVLSFSSSWMTSSSALGVMRNAPGATLLSVHRWRTLTGTNLNHVMFFSSGSAADSSRVTSVGGLVSNNVSLFTRRQDGTGGNQLHYPLTANTWIFFLGVADFANTDGFLYINGSQYASNLSWEGTGNTTNSDSLRASIGSHNGSNFSPIDVAEMFAWNRALTTTEISNMHTYLTNKYGTPS